MPLATGYTDDTLKAYMAAQLGATAGVLGWATDNAAYSTALNDALRAYGGVTAADAATDVARLEALARREIWRRVVAETTGDYDTASDSDSLKRSQINAQARLQLAEAERDVAAATTTPDEGRAVLGSTSAPVRVAW